MTPPEAQGTPAGEAADPRFERAYPRELRARESALIANRRKGVEVPASEGRVGFGLSGGGIRSATFCLGVFQGLARQGGLLKRIDFLSTVSGGGYFGGFYGRLLGRPYIAGPGDVEEILQGQGQPEVLRNLRENGRYISPNGAGDVLLAAAILLRNWVSIQLVLLVFLLSGFLALQSLRGILQGLPALAGRFDGWGPGLWWSPFLILPGITFLLGAFPIGWAYWLIPHENLSLAAAVKKEDGKEDGEADGKPRSAPRPVEGRPSLRPWMVLASTFVLFVWLTVANLGWEKVWLWEILAVIVAATFVWWQAAMRQRLAKEPETAALSERERVAAALYRNLGHRNRLGIWVTRALVVTALLLAVALVDTLGETVYLALHQRGLRAWVAGLFASWTLLAGFAQRIASLFSKGPQKSRLSPPLNLIAAVVALTLAGIVLVGVDAASHAIAWKLGDPLGVPASLQPAAEAGAEPAPAAAPAPADPGPALLGFAATFLLALLFGQIWPFVNDSSHQAMYSARLTRAYLGASNPKRFSGGTSVTDVLPDDDADLAHYWPPPAKAGAPVHLINVTIDETIDGRSQIVQKDRKGNGMALGPCGLSVNVEHHLVGPFGDDGEVDPAGSAVDIFPREGFRVFDYPAVDGRAVFAGEMLPLGSWVGISGAAFSTGAGYRTSLGLSLLAGLGNVRLGRWWDSGVERAGASGERTGARPNLGTRCEAFLARLFPVQVYLLDEFLARFPGTARRHWYLSDGGHFEDLGGYELLRRRLPLIVLVDAEQDADYGFEALANLVRKARLDFGAEIEFLAAEELDREVDPAVRPCFGTLEALRRGERGGVSRAHAALARVAYPGSAPESRLLLIKPALTGDEPEDLLQYHAAHPDFPQESTADQFFDEAQWESYRKLGEHVAEALFAPPAPGSPQWCPRRMGRVASL